MSQLTLRVADELHRRLREAAAARGVSVNTWASAVLAAATDPDLAGDETERVRERLRRAGLLAAEAAPRPRPARAAVERARAAAAGGAALSDLVTEDRR